MSEQLFEEEETINDYVAEYMAGKLMERLKQLFLETNRVRLLHCRRALKWEIFLESWSNEHLK
jgi:hypothetical protein